MLITNTRALTSLFAALLWLVFAGCKSHGKDEVMDSHEFVKAINDKQAGLFTKKIGKVEYQLLYKPTDYMILFENKDKQLTPPEMEALRKDYGSMEYYTLEIMVDGGADEMLKYNIQSRGDYDERVDYYAFKFQNGIYLTQEQDTFPCTLYHFERNYGLSPRTRFTLAFKRASDLKEKTIVCNEKYLGTGTVKITITPRELAEMPVLNMN